jgi:adenylyltransferase/sulfurtransferase
VLVIGAGGLGCPALLALLDSGASFLLADDDQVELTNLHRQLLYDDADVGTDKLEAARRALVRRGVPESRIELERSRFLPENARRLARSVELVLEGADNYATKFLAADAARLEARPIVHGAAVRWVATAFAVPAEGRPCYRCLFEDLPQGGAEQRCAEAGVVGPVVGIAGALMAELALRVLTGVGSAAGAIHTYDGRSDRLRRVEVRARAACSLCGESRSISEINESRYVAQSCAA